MRWWSSPRFRSTHLLIYAPLFGSIGCGSCGIDEEARIRCAVELGGDVPELVASDPASIDSLALGGPHPVWSTQPHRSCNYNPTFRSASGEHDLEMLLTYPAATDPLVSGFGDVANGTWPIILFAHANNYKNCRLLDEYTGFHEHWARWGYVVVSVDAAHLCEKNSTENLEGRRNDLLAAWAHLKSMTIDVDSPLLGKLDTESVVLAGHSRGATGALLAANWIPETDALIWLQGVDTAGYRLGHPPVRVPTLGVVAELDRDIEFPKAEPTADQLMGGHAWVHVEGGIHAFTTDSVPAKSKDAPEITRQEQISLTAHLSTLLLAGTTGVSNNAEMQPNPAALQQLFGPQILDLHPNVDATWERAQSNILWVDDFQNNNDANISRLVSPTHSSRRTHAWKPGEDHPGRILGDDYAMQLRAQPTTTVTWTFDQMEQNQPLPAGTKLVFRIKDLEPGPLTIQLHHKTGVLTESVSLETSKRTYQQVELNLHPNQSISMHSLSFLLNEGSTMIDDIRLVPPLK